MPLIVSRISIEVAKGESPLYKMIDVSGEAAFLCPSLLSNLSRSNCVEISRA